MCLFITATLPAVVDVTAAPFRSDGLLFEALANASVQRRLGPDERYFRATASACDCGTPLGAGAPSTRVVGRRDRRAAVLRRKGWSEAKLRRWREDQERVGERDRRVAEARARLGDLDLAAWQTRLAAILGASAAHVGLLLHQYRGELATEVIALRGQRVVPQGDATVELLRDLEEDVLYRFVARRR